jgi:3-hydroxyisobutyrate dehydrogenase-like beta-hydroxyacid dehydrogenase
MPRPANPPLALFRSLKRGLKDVRLVLAAAEECAAPMHLASLIRDQLLSAIAQGQGEWDWSGIATVPARNAGLLIT